MILVYNKIEELIVLSSWSRYLSIKRREENIMRRTRDRSGSKLIHLYPQLRECPECQKPLEERYHKERWIVQLGQKLHVISHFLECHTGGCRLREAVYRPEGEDILALRGYTFGLDVIVFIGELRYCQRRS